MSATERPYAGIVSRTVALAIDAGALTVGFAVASGVLGLILSLFTAVEVSSPGAVLGAAGLWSLVVANYFVLFWTLAGETPGMRLMALRVSNGAGGPPRLGQALLRLVGMILAALPFFAGYLLVLFDERRRGLHDVLAGTVVVYAPKSRVRTSPPAAMSSSQWAPYQQMAQALLWGLVAGSSLAVGGALALSLPISRLALGLVMAFGAGVLISAAAYASSTRQSRRRPAAGVSPQAFVQAFAGGAILTMLADTMMPEAFEHGGRLVGLATTLGFAVAFGISALE